MNIHYNINLIIIMDPQDPEDELDPNYHTKKSVQPEELISSSHTTFKTAFFNLIKTQKPSIVIEQFLIAHRKILCEKIFLHLVSVEPKLYNQYRYLLLGISLSFEKKQQYHQRWATFYQIINQILKIPLEERKLTGIETDVLNFTLFLLDKDECFFKIFNQSLNIFKTSTFQVNLNKNDEQNILSVKKIVRIFNSLLCLKFITVQQYLLLIYYFSSKSQNYTDFLLNIEEKFLQRMTQYQNNFIISQAKQFGQNSSPLILDPIKIYLILHIFYDLDPEDKLRALMKTSVSQETLKKLPNNLAIVLSKTLPRRTSKNKITYYGNLLKFIVKEVIKNKKMQQTVKKQFLIQCFHQINQIDEDLYEYLLQSEGGEQSQIISDILMKYVEKQSLRFVTVSRIKSILKRISLSKMFSYSTNLHKMFKILRLLVWVAKKFNQSHPTYQFDLNSSLKISHIRKALMIIFSIDFREPQVGRIIQFQVNKRFYDILIKYTQSEQSCRIEIITQVDGQQKLKQKKEVNKWSYILCMIGLCEKKQIGIFIDSAYFKIPLQDSANQITQIQFGPFSGALKDVYILDKLYQMCQMHKKYFDKCRKMDLLLSQLGEKQFIFTFDRGKTTQKTKWFWRKQMAVQYKHVKKLRSISFGEGIEQLGGFPALLYLITRVISQQTSEDLVNFLIDFFEFLNLLINQGQNCQALKWMLSSNSTMYFGEFLWLILNKNLHLRSQKILFNRILNFFGWFFKLESNQITFNLKFAIVQDIYLNFQIWSKCSFQIKMLLLNQLQIRLQDITILLQMVNRQGYDRIISSLVFFFIEEGPENNSQTRLISKINVSQVHEKLSIIASKFCQLYGNEKFQYSIDILKKDINTVIGLITTFFYKKHLYFSKGQLSALTVLLDHFRKNFSTFQILQKTSQLQIYIVNQLSVLISNCPSQCQAIFTMFELGLALLSEIDNYKNATALIIDGVTLNGKRSSDSLQFSFKATMYIAKNSVIIYEPNSIFSEEQILSVLLGSLRKKANQSLQKLKYTQIYEQFQTFNIIRLKKLLSLTQFCMVLKECVQAEYQLQAAVLFLKITITNKILPDVALLAINCIKSINEITKQKYKRMQQQISESKGENKQQQFKINESNLINGQQNSQIYRPVSQSTGKQEQTMQQKQQCLKDPQNKMDIQSIKQLQQVLLQSDLESLYRSCRCPELIELLMNFGNYNSSMYKFQLPLNEVHWINNVKSYGGDLAMVFKTPMPTIKQLEILVEYIKNNSNINYIVANGKKQQQGIFKNMLKYIMPLYVIYSCVAKISAQGDKYSNSNQLLQFLKSGFDNLRSREVLTLWAAIKFNKKYIENLQKKDDLDIQKKRLQLLDISRKIVSQYEAHFNIQNTFQKQLSQLKSKLEKQKWSLKYLFDNAKSMKKINEELKQIITGFQQFVQLFSKIASIPSDKQQSPSIVRKRAESVSRKKKVLQIPDVKQRQKYSQFLKSIIKTLCWKMQKQSKKKQEMWRNLSDKNIFWISSKIKNNQCYEIHPKITGFYKLNIVKTAFQDIPYPRRKSFEHELQEQIQNEDKIQTKLPSNEMIKTFLMPEESAIETKTKRRKSQNIQSSSNMPLSQIPVPKDFYYAQYVTQKGVYAGILYYDDLDHSIIFKSKGYDFLPKDSIVYQFSTIFHRLDDKQFKIRVQLNNKSQIFARRYIHRHTAIQIFSFHKTYFFNLFFKESRQRFFKLYSNKVTCISDLRQQFQKRKYTEKWMHGRLDNFQYLMLVNIFSGRTTNDLAQYLVMPWVITNYDIKQVQINKQFMKDPNNIRDLEKPSGKLNQKKFMGLKMRCNQIQFDDLDSKFLFGTMYSNPTVIYNFFIRLQPFTTLHWQHQGRRIDHADRLFSAVKDQFNTVLTSTSDNKQLVPQFYYWPEFLRNRNKVNLGTKQNKEQVHDVKLPGWARNPEQFIFKMRQVLESPEITRKVHHWIDLVFGFKSSPRQVALQYDNLFHFRTYEHDIFQTQQSQQGIKGAQISISQFGQIPYPLFTKPHPQKNLLFLDHIKLDTYAILRKQSAKKIYRIQLKDEGFFVAYENQVEFFYTQISKSIDFSLQKNSRSYKSIGFNLQTYDFNNNVWFTLKDGVFRIFDKKYCMFQSDLQMECYAFFGRYIFYGYRSQLIVAKIDNNYKLVKTNSFYGHKNNIYKIEISVILDIIVSIDQDGLVLIHQFQNQKLVRQFDLGSKSQITNVCIHQMGYFIFLTKDQKLIIYTFLGELFFNQDIGITNKAIAQLITKIVIFEQNKSHLLVSTDKGKIYVIDFLQIKRFNDSSIYKEFSRFKINILENCPRLGTTSAIKDFIIKPVPGEQVLTYKIYLLYENNCVLCFYSAEQFQEKIKKNKMLGQLGLFDVDKQKEKLYHKSKSRQHQNNQSK